MDFYLSAFVDLSFSDMVPAYSQTDFDAPETD